MSCCAGAERGARDAAGAAPVPGAGVAYSTAEPTHRINVPAARMQLAGDEEGAFDHWYRHQPAFTVDVQALRPDGSVYPQRGQFGRYVAQRFADAAASSGGRLRHLRDRALAFHQGMVTTDGGLQLKADLLVLAISHPPPALPAQAEAWRHHPALIANPWQPGALDAIAPHARVAVMGTGLTMADTVATLDRLGHRGSIVAFSRHGLLSRGNLSGAGATWPGDYQQGSLRQRLRQIRLDVAYAAQQGLSWQGVLDAVRQQGQRIWQALSVAAPAFSAPSAPLLGCPPLPRGAAGRRGAGGAPAHGQSAGAGGQATVDKR